MNKGVNLLANRCKSKVCHAKEAGRNCSDPKLLIVKGLQEKAPSPENHAVQNTSERVSHHLPYAAKDYGASEHQGTVCSQRSQSF